MVKIAIVGVGRWGSKILRNFYVSDRVAEIVIYDINPRKVTSAKAEFPKIKTAESLEAILTSEVEAVVVATRPAATHYQFGKLVLQSGKHLWLEKPMAMSVAEARELVGLAEQKQRLINVDHTFIYSEPVNKIKDILDSGELGRIKYILMSRVNRQDPNFNEDVFWDLSWHDLAVLFFWFKEIFNLKTAFGQKVLSKEVKDYGHMVLTSPSGIEAVIESSCLGFVKTRTITIFGDEKVLVYNDLQPDAPIKIYNIKGFDIEDNPEIPQMIAKEPLAVEVDHFIDCLEQQTESRTSGRSGLQIVELLESVSKAVC